MNKMKHQCYDIEKSYEWNYDNCPPRNTTSPPVDVQSIENHSARNHPPNQPQSDSRIALQPTGGQHQDASSQIPWQNKAAAGKQVCETPTYRFLGLPVASPLGIAAGPLLNGNWVLHYSQLGFDVLTYKTVRTQQRSCYPAPNLVPVDTLSVAPGQQVKSRREMTGSWAISFGMPSMPPEQWTKDVRWTRDALADGKLLSVSVVATPKEWWTDDDLASDYACCAELAVASGADCIEANFSCPNVCSADGQLYQSPKLAAKVARTIRHAVGNTPLAIKIGHVTTSNEASALCEALAGIVDGISMTNCIAATVHGPNGHYFDGQPRGIGGAAIRAASVRQVQLFSQLASAHGIALIGVGGVASAQHVQEYLAAGAHAVHVATAAMVDPEIGISIQRNLS